MKRMKKVLTIFLLTGFILPTEAQQILSLDSCRALALRNNKQLNIGRLKQEVALNTRKAARTKYLPHVNVLGGYEFTSKEISLLNNGQKNALSNLGTNAVTSATSGLTSLITDLTQKGLITPQMAQSLGSMIGSTAPTIQQAGNSFGQSIRDAFRTDTRNIFTASAIVSQPIYMGGAITAANRMADITEEMTANDTENRVQNTLFNTDQAYWTVVSLRNKQKLANSFLKLVKKLDDDVSKMIKEGVATRADGLKVDVKVNEAEMQVTQVDDGLSLAKMYLCQLCGLPISDGITLADENNENLGNCALVPKADIETARSNRPELKMLQNAIDISKQTTKLINAEYMPQVAMTAGYLVSNPNLYNGFEKKFSGIWNIGVIVRVPVWNWFEGTYKVRASKAATTIATMEMNDASEKIELQVNQSTFKVNEANKRLIMAKKNTERAEENLRCANLGFKEGVIETTDVMAAQTAWLQAQSQKIDAEIDVKLSQVNLQKALGLLQ